MGKIESNAPTDSVEYFGGAGRAELLKVAIQFAVSPQQSSVVFHGPGGIGKSLLLRRVERHLSAYRHVTYLNSFFQTPYDFFRNVCVEFGIAVHWNLSELDLRTALQSFLASRDKPSLLLIDNAHEASTETLAQIFEFIASFEQLKAIVAIDTHGSESLREDVRKCNVPAIAIRPIARPALKSYLKHTMPNTYFSPEQLVEIHRLSEGIPERIDAAAKYTAAGMQPRNFDPQAHLESSGFLKRIQPEWLRSLFARQWSPNITVGVGAASICIAASFAVANSTLLPDFSEKKAVKSSMRPVERVAEPAVLQPESYSSFQWQDFTAQIPPRLVPPVVVLMPVENNTPYAASEQPTKNTVVLSEQEQGLLEESGSGFVLQLMAGDSQRDIVRFVNRYQQFQFRFYRTVQKDNVIFKAISQSYAKREQAIKLIAQLPQELQQSKPWVRSLSRVQRELSAFTHAPSKGLLRLSSAK